MKVSFVPDSIPGTGDGSLAPIALVYSSVSVDSQLYSGEMCFSHKSATFMSNIKEIL